MNVNLNVYRASTHAEILVESSADKHSYETVDKPILLCIP